MEVFQRTRKGLSDLSGNIGRGLVGSPMVLSSDRSKFGLQKQRFPLDPFVVESQQGLTNEGLIVMII